MNILVFILCQTLSWGFLHVLSQLSIIHTLCPLILFSNYPPSWPTICPPPAQRCCGRQDLLAQAALPVLSTLRTSQSPYQLITVLPGPRRRALYFSDRKELWVFICLFLLYFLQVHRSILSTQGRTLSCLDQYLKELLNYKNHDLQHSIYFDKTPHYAKLSRQTLRQGFLDSLLGYKVLSVERSIIIKPNAGEEAFPRL